MKYNQLQVEEAQQDWFDNQTFDQQLRQLEVQHLNTIKWNTIADKPGTSEYAAARGGSFDEVHVVVIDAKGTVTGNAGTILRNILIFQKQKMLSSLQDHHHTGENIFIITSEYIFGGGGATIGTLATGFSSAFFCSR